MSRRLDALLAHAGFGTRSEVKRLVRTGRVTVDGEPCRKASRALADEVVAVDGVTVERGPAVRVVILHKPVGYACSHDPNEAPLVDELLPPAWLPLGLQPAGRLDRETSGLLILTSDGQLIHRLTHPGRKLPKRYRLRYTGELPADAVERCAAGILLKGESDDELTHPSELILDGPGSATLILREGRYHQVRRMAAALGVTVTALHRDRIGSLDLPQDLAAGAARPLGDDELVLLIG